MLQYGATNGHQVHSQVMVDGDQDLQQRGVGDKAGKVDTPSNH